MSNDTDFDNFSEKVVALGRALKSKGGREIVKFMLGRKGAATRMEVIQAAEINAMDAHRIIVLLKDGGMLDVPDGNGGIMRLSPTVKLIMQAISKPVEEEGVTSIKKGKMTAKFTKVATKADPLCEGTCGDYSFTAIMNEDVTKGIWGTAAEHFVMRDRNTQHPVAKHDPELGWTKRPNSPKKITHFELIERLFRAAPKNY